MKSVAPKTNRGISSYTESMNDREVLHKEKSITWIIVTGEKGGRG